jgi:hypothetical protein
MIKPTFAALIGLLCATSALAASIGDPVPANPCLGGGRFKAKLAVLDVSSDGGAGPCAGIFADTAITCTTKTGGDLAVEYVDEFGMPMNPGFSAGPDALCGVPAGFTITWTLSPLPAGPAGFGPYAIGLPSTLFVPAPAGSCGPGCAIHGFARVFSTDSKAQCTASRIDTSAFCSGAAPTPLATKNLTIIRVPKQKGD